MIYVLLILALALMTLGYVFKRTILAIGAAGAWALLAGYCYTLATSETDIYFLFFILCCGFVVASAFEPFLMRRKTEDVDDGLSPDERQIKEEFDAVDQDMHKFDFLDSGRKRGSNKRSARID